jgi:hypothetical protein
VANARAITKAYFFIDFSLVEVVYNNRLEHECQLLLV